MSKKIPVKIYLQEKVIQQLQKAAKDHYAGLLTYNQVAAVIISRCLPLWLKADVEFEDLVAGTEFEDRFRKGSRDEKLERQKNRSS